MDRAAKKATIKDVAQLAGVSVQTVSNFINDRPFMRAETRQRVLLAMRELSYSPNYYARGLRSGQSRAFGFVLIDPAKRFLADPFRNEVIAGLTSALAERGYSLSIHALRPEHAPEAVAMLHRQRRIDGATVVIVGNEEERAALTAALIDIKVPLVLLEEHLVAPTVSCVLAGHQHGLFEAADYLLRDAHRRIAFIHGENGYAADSQRLRGYRRALAYWNIPLDSSLLVRSESTAAGGYEAMMQLLRVPDRPTAVLTSSDLMAIGVVEAVRTAHLAVPEDVAVIGFNDLEFCTYLQPALASVRLPAFDMGHAAGQLLLEFCDKGEFSQSSITIPTSLLIRRSAQRNLNDAGANGGGESADDRKRFARKPPYRIALIHAGIPHMWRKLLLEQARLEARKHPEIDEFQICDGAAGPQKQANDLARLLDEGVDAIIIDPAGSDELAPVIDAADRAGVTTILLDARIPHSRYTVLVTPDEVMVGTVWAEDLVKRMGPEGNVVLLQGPQGWPVCADRTTGMDLVLNNYRGIQVLARQHIPEWSRAEAFTVMRAWLQRFPRIDGVLAHSGLMLEGARDAAKLSGREDEITFAGFDGYLGALRHIYQTGEGIGQLIPSWIGAECVKVALKVLRGETVPKLWRMSTVVIDQRNIMDWYDPSQPDDTFESLLQK